jgi:hypothetical protein
MNIKIVSDGTALNTRIIDADTGQDISNDLHCSRIEIDTSDDLVRATFQVHSVPLDLVAPDPIFEREATLYFDPNNTDSIDRAIAELQRQRAAQIAS